VLYSVEGSFFFLTPRGCFVSYNDLDNVPTQTAGSSEVLASDWNKYVRDNFDALKFGHLVVGGSPSFTPDAGTMVYRSDRREIQVYDGNDWIPQIPTGVMQMFVGGVAPLGWLLCQGQALSVASPTLQSILTGAGFTTIPDLRGKIPIGQGTILGTARALGATVGAESLPEHSHTFSANTSNTGSHSHGGGTSSAGAHSHTIGLTQDDVIPRGTGVTFQRVRFAGSVSTSTDGTHSHTINADGSHSHSVSGTTGNAGTGTHGVVQPSLVINFIIKN
jgi:microcystin-dependent protein